MFDWTLPEVLYLALGAIVIGVGGVLATWGIDRLKEHNAIAGWMFITLGALAIGLGGIATSSGWNIRSDREQKRAILISVAREWDLNQTSIEESVLLDSDTLKIDGAAGPMYPRFSKGAAMTAITSGLFDDGERTDSALLVALTLYARSVHSVNVRFDVWEPFNTTNMDGVIRRQKRWVLVRSVRWQEHMEIHTGLNDFLNKNYDWLSDHRL